MDLKGELSSAFSSFSKDNPVKEWKRLVYILCTECGWTQKDIEETDIPFILDFLDGRNMAFAEEKKHLEKQQRNSKRR